jgi:hypothetical protein
VLSMSAVPKVAMPPPTPALNRSFTPGLARDVGSVDAEGGIPDSGGGATAGAVRRGSLDPAGVPDLRSPALTAGPGFTGILAFRA